MSCNCGDKYQRVFPANNNFSVRLSVHPAATPLIWKTDKLFVCIECGDVAGRVPDDVLLVFRKSDGEPAS